MFDPCVNSYMREFTANSWNVTWWMEAWRSARRWRPWHDWGRLKAVTLPGWRSCPVLVAVSPGGRSVDPVGGGQSSGDAEWAAASSSAGYTSRTDCEDLFENLLWHLRRYLDGLSRRRWCIVGSCRGKQTSDGYQDICQTSVRLF